MRARSQFSLPEDKQRVRRKAIRLEWATVGLMGGVVVLIGLTMGSSQAMKAAWVEDLLSLVPPLAFLVASRFEGRAPNEKFPYGYRRAMSISFLIASAALFAFGGFILVDSVVSLVRAEHPTIGSRELFGRPVWSGWLMVAALAVSIVPPVVLGRLKLPLSHELHDKTLHADAAMNKADWLTGGAGILGVLGIGAGWWWADPVAASIIALDITHDGAQHLRRVIEDLMDRRPMSVDNRHEDDTPQKACAELEKLPWVQRADIRLREEGQVLVGEAFVVPRDDENLTVRLALAGNLVRGTHWRLDEVVVTAVPKLLGGEQQDPDGGDRESPSGGPEGRGPGP